MARHGRHLDLDSQFQRGVAAWLVHQPMGSGGVILVRSVVIPMGVWRMIVRMPMAVRMLGDGQRMLGGMRFGETGEHRTDDQPEHQQRQKAGTQELFNTGEMRTHFKQDTGLLVECSS